MEFLYSLLCFLLFGVHCSLILGFDLFYTTHCDLVSILRGLQLLTHLLVLILAGGPLRLSE